MAPRLEPPCRPRHAERKRTRAERIVAMGSLTVTPPPPLNAMVARPWDCDRPAAAWRMERILPQPRAAMIVNLAEDQTRVYADEAGRACRHTPGFVVSGPYAHSVVIDTREQTRVMGVEFRTAGAAAVRAERLDRLAGRHLGVDALSVRHGRRAAPATAGDRPATGTLAAAAGLATGTAGTAAPASGTGARCRHARTGTATGTDRGAGRRCRPLRKASARTVP